MKLFPIKKILILVTILAVPGFLYYMLQDQGKNRYKPLPYFGPKPVASTFHSVRGKKIPDTNYHEIADFNFINQLADSASWKSYEGKIVILNLFYTHDNSATTIANNAISVLRKTYGKNDILKFVSLSVDPVRDVPEVLSSYAKKQSAENTQWAFLTGDSAGVYNFINKQLFLDAFQKREGNNRRFVYTNKFVLIDTKHRIRGYYDISTQEGYSKLDDEIKVQIVEELRNNTDGR